jgi:hypothetical protein
LQFNVLLGLCSSLPSNIQNGRTFEKNLVSDSEHRMNTRPARSYPDSKNFALMTPKGCLSSSLVLP